MNYHEWDINGRKLLMGFLKNLMAIHVNIKLNMNYHEWDMNCRELLMEFVDDLMKIRVKKVF